MEVVLYTITGCPKCAVLKKKLDAKGIQYKVKHDEEEEMIAMGFKEAPILVADGVKMRFPEANKWTDKYGN